MSLLRHQNIKVLDKALEWTTRGMLGCAVRGIIHLLLRKPAPVLAPVRVR